MKRMLALVANEPPLYRQLISDALIKLRPLVEVASAEPEELDEAVRRLGPHLVICSGATEAVRAGCLLCLVLYPGGEDRAEVWTCGGEASSGEGAPRHLGVGVGVAELLRAVDEAGLLCHSA